MMNERPTEPERNDLYSGLDRLPAELWDDLAGLRPDDVLRRAGVAWEPGGYLVPFLNVDHLVNPLTRTIAVPEGARPPGFQEGLVLVSYLIRASEMGLSGRMVTVRELTGGDLFFTGPHALRTWPVEERYGRNAAEFVVAGKSLGGMPLSNGDASFRLLALPKVLMACTLYEADEEFQANLTVTFDAATDRHLPLDCIWALVNVVGGRLVRFGQKEH
jgi:hypothetical protein